MGRTFKGELQGEGLRLALVVARFNESITTRLLAGAQDALEKHGVREDDVDVAWVPGSFEVPFAAQRLAESQRYDAVVCLGAVIRHETAHFEHVATQAAEGIQRAALGTGVPCIFGVLTCDTNEQALARAGGEIGNNGYEAVVTAVEMANLNRQLRAG